jgi:hypothetical protein
MLLSQKRINHGGTRRRWERVKRELKSLSISSLLLSLFFLRETPWLKFEVIGKEREKGTDSGPTTLFSFLFYLFYFFCASVYLRGFLIPTPKKQKAFQVFPEKPL